MTVYRTCGRCGDMWTLSDVRCGTCNSLLVLTTGDRVNAKAFGGRKSWEAPSGRTKDAS